MDSRGAVLLMKVCFYVTDIITNSKSYTYMIHISLTGSEKKYIYKIKPFLLDKIRSSFIFPIQFMIIIWPIQLYKR